MVAVFLKSCSSRVDCVCINCKNKKQKIELNKYKKQNVQMAVPQVLKQLSTSYWKTANELSEELNIQYQIVCKALSWLEKHEPKLLVDKDYVGKDNRLVRIFSLMN